MQKKLWPRFYSSVYFPTGSILTGLEEKVCPANYT